MMLEVPKEKAERKKASIIYQNKLRLHDQSCNVQP